MKRFIAVCFLSILFLFPGTTLQAGTVSGLSAPRQLVQPQVLTKTATDDSKTQQAETIKLPVGTAVVRPAVQPAPALPGAKSTSPVAPAVSPAVKTSPPARSPVVKSPAARIVPVGKTATPQLRPMLTKPGGLVPGMKGGASVSGVTVGKMQGSQQAELLVRGKGLNKVTSAMLFLNNRPVPNVSLRRGLATDSNLKISLNDPAGKLKNNKTAKPGNYELRLRVGMEEIKVLTPLGTILSPAPINMAGLDKMKDIKMSKPGVNLNTESSGGSQGSSGTPTDGPDLIVSSIGQSVTNPVEGQGFNFVFEIKNQGNWAANFPYNTKLIESSLDQNSWVGSMGSGGSINLQPGQIYTVTQHAGQAVAGTNPVWVRVDPENAITESNESNNETQGSYTVLAPQVQGPADLVITNITTNPATPSVVTGFKVRVDFENRGGTAVSFTQNSNFIKTIGSNNVLRKGYGLMHPGYSGYTEIWASNIVPGPFSWTVMIDPDNLVQESDESNNTMSISGTIGQ